MVKCSAYLCDSVTYRYVPGLTFHRFPKNRLAQQAWVANMKRKNWKPSSASVLCSKHFEERHIHNSQYRTRLYPGAMPTLFEHLPESSNVSKESKLNQPTIQQKLLESPLLRLRTKKRNFVRANSTSLPEKDLKNFNDCKTRKSSPVLKSTARLRYVSDESELKEPAIQETALEQPLLSLRTRKRKSVGASSAGLKRGSSEAMNDYSKACRCCLLKVGPMKPIFGSSLDTMLSDLMGFKISRNDGYPQLICTRCIRKLSSAHNFYRTVSRSHRTVEENSHVIRIAVKIESSPDFVNTEDEDRIEKATTTFTVGCQTEEEYFQKLMLANVQLSRVEPDNMYEMPEEEYVMVSEPECEEVERKYEIMEEIETYEEFPDGSIGHKCPQCMHVAESEADLKIHMDTHVTGAALAAEETTPGHLCNICGQTFKCRTSLYKHLRFHSGHIFQCKYCDKQFAEQSTLKVHLITHSLTNAKPFDCTLCERSFSQKAALRKHERAMHAAARPVVSCDECDSTFLYRISLNKHILRHHTVSRCNLCDAEFTGLKALEVHLKRHKQKAFEAEYLEFDAL